MKLLNDHHSFTGMQRDLSVSKHPTSVLYDALNIRLTARGEDTLLTVTNERGPLYSGVKIEGSYLGHCTLGRYLVVFSTTSVSEETSNEENTESSTAKAKRIRTTYTDILIDDYDKQEDNQSTTQETLRPYDPITDDSVLPWKPLDHNPSDDPIDLDNPDEPDEPDEPGSSSDDEDEETDIKPDYITRIDLSPTNSEPEVKILYNGNLGFSLQHPIEAIASYENANIQKVYWTDGENQPRVINIADIDNILQDVDSQFDFIRELKLEEEVSIQKQLGAAGSFAPGVIQYAFTYYTKYGQESNIFYVSPLLYISYKDRGGSPEDKVENAFKISIKKLDKNFDYVRIYSIQRTSINGTPIVRRVQDISTKNYSSEGVLLDEISFLDTGTVGDALDPAELLFKGGESIAAQTLEQKDNTLFLGNLTLLRPPIESDKSEIKIKSRIKSAVTISQSTRTFYPTIVSTYGYAYKNQLTSYDSTEKTNSVPCGGFKRGDYYRCGLQFQYKDGRWSNPIWKDDFQITNTPREVTNQGIEGIEVPTLEGSLDKDIAEELYGMGYRKVRAVVVYPEVQDRVTICQGVLCPTVYTEHNRTTQHLHAQSSWFFRPNYGNNVDQIQDNGSVAPNNGGLTDELTYELPYTSRRMGTFGEKQKPNWNPEKLRQVEIQGDFDPDNKFKVEWEFSTLHSPDVEFDDHLSVLDLVDTYYRSVGSVTFNTTFSDIEIQTSSPTISNSGGGFQHKGFSSSGPQGIVSGLFYDDYATDEKKNTDKFRAYEGERSSYKWFVYTWNRTGSLNNDINRPAGAGTRTALLKKKVISNLRYTTTDYGTIGNSTSISGTPQVFNSDQLSIVKVGTSFYQGNVDTLLSPSNTDGMYFAFEGNNPSDEDIDTKFTSESWWKTFNIKEETSDGQGLWKWEASNNWWDRKNAAIGDSSVSLVVQKEPVRMRYKSSPHIVLNVSSSVDVSADASVLPVIELMKNGAGPNAEKPYYRSTMFGGNSEDALKANVWIPCGEPKLLKKEDVAFEDVTFEYSYGDTYYQRWDCLKTYPFAQDDVNQVVEIGSFILETRINIDGRYDRNRGQVSNLNVTPQNFNLLNPVYSQVNNFFSYRILEEAYYNTNSFPNQITWTKEKQAGADTDIWTNITLASTYDMDGSKGAVTSLNTWKDQIFCFQDEGISTILFNSRVQIPTSDGVPIEITNSYKVDGYRYIGDGIGCRNKWTISNSPSGLYFIESISNHLYHIGEGMQDISTMHNMTSWFNNPQTSIVSTLYDNINHDVYLITGQEALCYSEILGQFTSFMSYDKIVMLESYNNFLYTMREGKLYFMFKGGYNSFFGTQKGWNFTFISNGIDAGTMDFDKTFSTLDYRMDMYQGATYSPDSSFDYIQVTNEYQDTGEVPLSRLKVQDNTKSYHHKGTNLQKKFRIWRIQIPRQKNSLNRIRNPWCKIKLGNNGNNYQKAVLHDLNVQYFV